MAGSKHKEQHLLKAILKIIAELQPLTTKDIWYELGEDYRYALSEAELTDFLAFLEDQKRIAMEDEKWKMRKKYSPRIELLFS